MPIATGLALGLGAGLSAAGALGGAAISSNAAGNAASTQANAADEAALIQQQDAAAALQFQEQQLNLAQQNSAPYRAVGQNALLANNDLMGLTPVAPQPINTGGNTAPQPTGGNPSNTATPGTLATPNTPAPPYPGAPMPPQAAPPGAPPPSAPSKPGNSVPDWMLDNPRLNNPRLNALARGGPIPRLAGGEQHYLVGEKGPEELTMFPNGTGWVTPNKMLPSRLAAIHRAAGGPISTIATPQNGGPMPIGNANPTANGPAAHTGASSGMQFGQGPYTPASPYGAQSNNPLVTGGSPNPVQNSPYSEFTQQFQAPGGAPGQFEAPTAAQAEAQPGYQFALQQGEQALANQASASGEIGDSNYGRSLVNYAEGAAEQNYGNVYNQALSTNQQQQADYTNTYDRAMQQYQNNYNIFNNNQSTQFNRLNALAGLGQTSTAQLNNTGTIGANNASQVLTQSGAQVGQQLNNAAAATASGYVGSANAYGGAVGNIGNAASTLPYLSYLSQQGAQPDYNSIDFGVQAQ